jgi:hypothetical protein
MFPPDTRVTDSFMSQQIKKTNMSTKYFLTNFRLKKAEEHKGVFINCMHITHIPTQDCARKNGHGSQYIHSIIESESNLQ